ncbi:hypothetical protein [Mucilaginibacter lacusdianchii]|uniref:hypothetical protein n=1 Tax=Mucilaginibacter lacusdianchii TaxID=2684211 RepID=UPI00131BE42E|nr:hypothetical protein [Mucilaginibacter sp. JXJ CY 39]
MPNVNDQYLIALLKEQTIKKAAFDEQIQLELSDKSEFAVAKKQRREYMKFLAGRLTQINLLLEMWADAVELNLDQILE